MPNLRAWILVAALWAFPGCEGENGSGGLTEEESRRLDEAAAMLDEEPRAPEPE